MQDMDRKTKQQTPNGEVKHYQLNRIYFYNDSGTSSYAIILVIIHLRYNIKRKNR